MDAITSLTNTPYRGERCKHTTGSTPASSDSVSVGGSSENVGIYKAARETVRPEVQQVLDAIPHSSVQGIRHTTRGLPMESLHVPSEPSTFGAGRFHVLLAEKTSGREMGFVFETEAGPGHLTPVTPGKTEISGGYISVLADPNADRGEATVLNRTETDRLITQLYQRYTTPMSDAQAKEFDAVISFASAVRYSGEGREAALGRHHELAAKVAR